MVRQASNNDARLSRRIKIAAIALIVIVSAFAIVYYRDRYMTPGGVVDQPGPTEQLEEAVRAKPSDPNVRMQLAESYLLKKRFDDAISEARQVLQAYPDTDRALLVVGVAENLKGNPSAAVQPLRKFIAIHEKAATANLDSSLEAARYFLGDSYIRLERPADAIKPLQLALQVNPTDADALYKLGVAYAGVDNHKDAISSYEKATMLVPDYKEAYEGLAASYTALGQNDLADYANAMVAFASNDYERARDALLKVVAAKKDFVPALLGLGLAYEQLGSYEEATASLKRALKNDPGNIAVKQAIGRVRAASQE